MKTIKYIITENGGFVIADRRTMLSHNEMQRLIGDNSEVVSAGFINEIRDEIKTYGMSVTLGLDSREEDAAWLLEKFQNGLARITEYNYGTIITSESQRVPNDVANLDNLYIMCKDEV